MRDREKDAAQMAIKRRNLFPDNGGRASYLSDRKRERFEGGCIP